MFLSEFQNSKCTSETLPVLARNRPSSSWSRPSSDLKLNTDAVVWSGVPGFGGGG
ncbi:hypothetical protein TorRG33x02_343120, partial [Trema orientale]